MMPLSYWYAGTIADPVTFEKELRVDMQGRKFAWSVLRDAMHSIRVTSSSSRYNTGRVPSPGNFSDNVCKNYLELKALQQNVSDRSSTMAAAELVVGLTDGDVQHLWSIVMAMVHVLVDAQSLKEPEWVPRVVLEVPPRCQNDVWLLAHMLDVYNQQIDQPDSSGLASTTNCPALHVCSSMMVEALYDFYRCQVVRTAGGSGPFADSRCNAKRQKTAPPPPKMAPPKMHIPSKPIPATLPFEEFLLNIECGTVEEKDATFIMFMTFRDTIDLLHNEIQAGDPSIIGKVRDLFHDPAKLTYMQQAFVNYGDRTTLSPNPIQTYKHFWSQHLAGPRKLVGDWADRLLKYTMDFLNSSAHSADDREAFTTVNGSCHPPTRIAFARCFTIG